MKETAITASILKWLREQPGVFCVKVAGGLYQRAGLPDVHATVAGRSVWLETKTPGKKPTPLQQKTLDDLFRAGAVCGVVTSLEDAQRLVKPLLIALDDSDRGGAPLRGLSRETSSDKARFCSARRPGPDDPGGGRP